MQINFRFRFITPYIPWADYLTMLEARSYQEMTHHEFPTRDNTDILTHIILHPRGDHNPTSNPCPLYGRAIRAPPHEKSLFSSLLLRNQLPLNLQPLKRADRNKPFRQLIHRRRTDPAHLLQQIHSHSIFSPL